MFHVKQSFASNLEAPVSKKISPKLLIMPKNLTCQVVIPKSYGSINLSNICLILAVYGTLIGNNPEFFCMGKNSIHSQHII